MKEIITNKDQVILVDDFLYEKLSKKTWYLLNGYAESTETIMSRAESRKTGKRRLKNIKMHRYIYELVNNVNLCSSDHIDHINRIKTDNRIENLRISKQGESSLNAVNVGLRKDNTTGYKGVVYREKTGKYEAKISFKGKRIWLGSYKNIKDAAKAYNKKAVELFGNNIYLNIII